MTKTQVIKRVRENAEESFLDENFGGLDLSGFPHLAEPLKEESLEDERFAPLSNDRPMRLRNELTRFVNQNASDPEIAGTLRAAGVEDLAAPHKFYIDGEEATVFLGNDNVWRVTLIIEGRQQTIKCASAKSRDEAQVGAQRWLSGKSGPKVHPLTKDQELYVARLAGMGKRAEAVMNYLAYAVPDYQGTDIASDVKYAEVCNACAWYVFVHSTPQFQDSDEAREYMTAYVGSRPVTLELLQFAFDAYRQDKEKQERGLLFGQVDSGISRGESEGPSYDDLDELDTKEIERLRRETLRLRAKQVRSGIPQ